MSLETLSRCDAWNSLISGSECKSWSEFINEKLASIKTAREDDIESSTESTLDELPENMAVLDNAYGSTVISKRELNLLNRFQC